jgi:hypothetical protein
MSKSNVSSIANVDGNANSANIRAMAAKEQYGYEA